ncbi:hypothetical protein PSPO01_03288 [Paraphaeosphaeria sporulosa]
MQGVRISDAGLTVTLLQALQTKKDGNGPVLALRQSPRALPGGLTSIAPAALLHRSDSSSLSTWASRRPADKAARLRPSKDVIQPGARLSAHSPRRITAPALAHRTFVGKPCPHAKHLDSASSRVAEAAARSLSAAAWRSASACALQARCIQRLASSKSSAALGALHNKHATSPPQPHHDVSLDVPTRLACLLVVVSRDPSPIAAPLARSVLCQTALLASLPQAISSHVRHRCANARSYVGMYEPVVICTPYASRETCCLVSCLPLYRRTRCKKLDTPRSTHGRDRPARASLTSQTCRSTAPPIPSHMSMFR